MESIKSLKIRGFKSIKQMDDLQLHDLNILIGANGAGKSNMVSFFHMLRELVEQRLQLWTSVNGGANRIATHGVKETKQIEFSMRFGKNGYDMILQPTVGDGLTFSNEKLYFEGNYRESKPDLGSGHNESKLKKWAQNNPNSIPSHCYKSISRWKVFHFHDTSDSAGVKKPCSLHDNEYLRPDASNLAAYLYRLKNESQEVYEKIREVVRLVLPFFDDFILKPQKLETEEEQIRLLWKQLGSDYTLWPSQLSDGSVRFICLATALLQPSPPSTIIIDEPELGLHPFAITLLGSLMRSASSKMQLVISTQSVPLLNEFSIANLIIAEAEKGVSKFRRLDEKQFVDWLKDYSLGELWEKNILGGRPSR
jgi:predicted ATPase